MMLLCVNFIDLLVYTCIALSSYILYLWLKNEKLMKQYEKVISHFPSPPIRFLSGNELDFLFKMEDLAFVLLQYAKEYGSRFTLQLRGELYIVTGEPVDVEEILGSTKYVERGPAFLSSFGRFYGNGTFASPAHVWKKNRKVLQYPFRTNVLDEYTESTNDETKRLIQQLEEVAETGETFNVLKFLTTPPFNIFCRDFLDSDTNLPLNKHLALKEANTKHLDDCIRRLFEPKLVTFLRNIALKREESQLHENLLITYTKVYNEGKLKRSAQTYEPKDVRKFRKFIYCLLDGPFTDKDIKDDIVAYSAASTETVSATLSFVILMLGIHQDIQEKVYEEICSIFGDTGDKDVTADDCNKMIYLDQVIKETQRMFPLVPVLFRYLVESVKLGECTVPPGINIIINVYALHHDPRYFPDPKKFDPERFSPERKTQIPKGSFIPFSYGPRNCIGKAFAIHQMKILCSRIVYNFHIKSDKKLSDIQLISHFVLAPRDGEFPISISARKHKITL